MNVLVLYFTKTGNSKFLAEKVSKALDAPKTEIVPNWGSMFWIILKSLLKRPQSTNLQTSDFMGFDKVALIGPIWMGSLLAPLRQVVRMISTLDIPLYVLLSCGSSEDERHGKFGYQNVFDEIKKEAPDQLAYSCAISNTLASPTGTASNTTTDIRLSESNFTEPMKNILGKFVEKIKEEASS